MVFTIHAGLALIAIFTPIIGLGIARQGGIFYAEGKERHQYLCWFAACALVYIAAPAFAYLAVSTEADTTLEQERRP